MRYVLQEWELTVRIPSEIAATAGVPDIVGFFHATHQARYGFARPDMPVEFVALLVSASSPADAEPQPASARGRSGAAAEPAFRRVYIDPAHGAEDVRVHERRLLVPGDVVAGPCLVEEPTATAYVQPGWLARVDELGNLIARRET